MPEIKKLQEITSFSIGKLAILLQHPKLVTQTSYAR